MMDDLETGASSRCSRCGRSSEDVETVEELGVWIVDDAGALVCHECPTGIARFDEQRRRIADRRKRRSASGE
jgi:hypothetical protein